MSDLSQEMRTFQTSMSGEAYRQPTMPEIDEPTYNLAKEVQRIHEYLETVSRWAKVRKVSTLLATLFMAMGLLAAMASSWSEDAREVFIGSMSLFMAFGLVERICVVRVELKEMMT